MFLVGSGSTKRSANVSTDLTELPLADRYSITSSARASSVGGMSRRAHLKEEAGSLPHANWQ
jgi:hypothetical protein